MRKTLLMIIAVLTTFLLVSDSIIYLHHKNTLYTEFRESRQQELKLIAMLSRDALLKRDQTSIRQLAAQWGMEQKGVIGLKISNRGRSGPDPGCHWQHKGPSPGIVPGRS